MIRTEKIEVPDITVKGDSVEWSKIEILVRKKTVLFNWFADGAGDSAEINKEKLLKILKGEPKE